MIKETRKLIPLADVQARMVLPTTRTALSYQNLMKLLKKLDIQPTKQKINGQGYPVNHITEGQAAQAIEDWKKVHHHKFKAAAAASKPASKKR